MSDMRVEIYQSYLNAWAKNSGADRAKLLAASLVDDIVFTNPTKTRHGRSDIAEHLEAFQAQMPGGTFRLNNMVGFDSYALIEWQFMSPEGEPGFTGYDAVTFAEDGRIANILMFVNVAPHKIVWHRRASVAL